jgi:hypothetical protein
MPSGILSPTFALVALIFVVWFTLYVQRFSHMRRAPPRPADFADGDSATRYFRPVELPAHNLANLFEMPVLYFALVPLLLITRHADHMQVVLAWAFVALRAVHSIIHVGPNKVPPRFFVYLASCVILSAMWIGFAIDMLRSAGVYDAAMRNMQG